MCVGGCGVVSSKKTAASIFNACEEYHHYLTELKVNEVGRGKAEAETDKT